MRRICFSLFCISAVSLSCPAQDLYRELYRPRIHFSPKEHWMNDPNGLVYFNGRYHLFFQYYPEGTVWGPMHWGHAISSDLMHWKQLPIALYPDSLGYIFSGSAVVDSNNTSGFAENGSIPLVAVFTQHDPNGEKEQNNHFQNQGIAYSLDNGTTWIKYRNNPVLKSPGLKDFRDPKVSWYAAQKKWIMTLAAGDRIIFYSSKNLKEWTKESEFGRHAGAHGGVWECPDLLSFSVNGKAVWLLLVNINPGGPQGGSATQYFTGTFDGKNFTCTDTATKWADYGADNYAGVTWSNTGNKKIFLGWMSNWQYAAKVPTVRWRSAMTLPRILDLRNIRGRYFTSMQPAPELESLTQKILSYPLITGKKELAVSGPSQFKFSMPVLRSFSIRFSNPQGQELYIGFDQGKKAFYINREKAGRSDFDPHFAAIHFAPRISTAKNTSVTLVLDDASLELFADDGLTTMTEIFFPDSPYNKIDILPAAGSVIHDLIIRTLQPVWNEN